ncbi:MAG: 50S ribosomal protein L1 [Candidatus Hecatellales archaeon]|nr:MAG: 50S ribosomal protein L1 [Candidatus Hecatellales archaeon]
MSLETKKIVEAVEKAKNSKRRGFTQSVDLIVNIQDIDLKKPENRITELVELPNPIDKEVKVCVIASGQLALEAKKAGADRVIQREDLEALAKDRKAARKLAKEYDFFVAEAPLMPLVGRALGPFLGPRGKMPTPVPSNAPIAEILERHRRLVRLRLKDQPTLQCRVGTETMDNQKIAENIQAVLKRLEEKLERGFRNIASVLVKTTMGKPVKVEVGRGR